MPKYRSQKVTRKQFLGISGAALASIFGIAGVINELVSRAATPTVSSEAESGTLSGTASVQTDSLASGGTAIRFDTAKSLARTWLSGHSGGDISAVGNAAWAASYYAPQALGGYADGKGGYADGSNGFASLIASVAQNPMNKNQAFFTGTDVVPSLNLSILTVGLIPHEIAFSSGAPTASEQDRLQSAALANTDQSYWKQVGANLVLAGWNHRNFVIRLGHEPNGNYYPWSTNNDVTREGYYRQAYANAVTAIRAGGATKVRFDLCMNARTGGLGSGGTVAAHYPGDSYVDIVSLDWYNFNGKTTVAGLNADQAVFPNFIDVPAYAAAHGKQFGTGEWGVHSGAVPLRSGEVRDQPAVAEWMFQVLTGLQVQYAHMATYSDGFIAYDCYFDTGVTALINNPLTREAYLKHWVPSA